MLTIFGMEEGGMNTYRGGQKMRISVLNYDMFWFRNCCFKSHLKTLSFWLKLQHASETFKSFSLLVCHSSIDLGCL